MGYVYCITNLINEKQYVGKLQVLQKKDLKNIVKIPDNTEKISIIIANGDMIMTYLVICDSCSVLRTSSFLDGVYIITKENFDKLNNLTNSYDISECTQFF